MNFRSLLNARLPVLREAHGEQIKRLEKQRREFVRDYSAANLARLSVRDYAIGHGPGTFCYRVERELDGLGRILGAPAYKFGVYFSRNDGRYRFTNIWGNSPDEAYRSLRAAVLQLLRDAAANDIDALKDSRISPMFKGKLLHLYFPQNFAPIYSPDHLEHFVSCLNLTDGGTSSVERQMALMEFRSENDLLRRESVGVMMRFLYDTFNPDAGDDEEDDTEDTPPTVPLSKAIAGLQLLDRLPKSDNAGSGPATPKPGKFNENNGRRKFIGDRGEALVLEHEKIRLRNAKRADLAKKVDHIAAKDDSRGYDILSFDADGRSRQIEVKATNGKNIDHGFYLTENERNAAAREKNYYLYFVFSALTSSPKIFMLKRPNFSGADFEFAPTQYRVTTTTDFT
jgi:hypothetical protein